MPIKFFPRDVIGGNAHKVGDKFTAQFFGGEHTFVVIEHYGNWFFAEFVDS